MNTNHERKEETRLLSGSEGESERIPNSDCNRKPGSASSTDEYQQVGGNRANSKSVSGGSIANSGREATIGGMLRQLREIHQDYLAYIENHTERLKARLAEDDERRRQAVRKIELLEQAIIERFEEDIPDDLPNP